eukprot:5102314-Pyramimonas_sp.AAC.1
MFAVISRVSQRLGAPACYGTTHWIWLRYTHTAAAVPAAKLFAVIDPIWCAAYAGLGIVVPFGCWRRWAPWKGKRMLNYIARNGKRARAY